MSWPEGAELSASSVPSRVGSGLLTRILHALGQHTDDDERDAYVRVQFILTYSAERLLVAFKCLRVAVAARVCQACRREVFV